MKTYKIWFATKPTFWNDVDNVERTMVAEVEGTSLEDIWQRCQNGMEDGWEERQLRSLSVGDVVEIEGEFHLVDMVGFKQIDKPSL